ncbi:MAG TPA: biopolymer transporter ExbD [Longimicrobiales bacterium]
MAVILRRRRPRSVPGIPTSSMADIAFNLLIFFLTATAFVDEKGLPLVLPPPDATVEVSARNILRFVIHEDGTVGIGRPASDALQPVDAEAVGAAWRAAAAHNPELVAVVEVDPRAPYDAMIAVLDELQGAGADRVSLQMIADGDR